MSLRLKTILGVGLIEAILLVILISSVVNYMRGTSYTDMENYVATTTTLFSTATQDAVLSQDLATLDTLVEEILKNQGVIYARILDSENITLAEGGDKKFLVTRRKIDKHINDVTDSIYDAVKKIKIDDEIYGQVSIGFSTESMQEALDDVKKMSATIALVEMILVAIFSYALGVYLTRQLNILRKSAIRISEGKLDRTIKINNKDEIADVAKAFNTMTENLKQSHEETKEYQNELTLLNQELEDRVNRRTEQLSKKNSELEQAYQKLQTTQEQLVHSEKLASIGQLAAGVAHEINNPVAFIKGNLSALKKYLSSYQKIIEEQQKVIEKCSGELDEENKETIKELTELIEEEDLDFINEDIETLLSESIHGTERVSEIVKGLKVYSRGHQEEVSEVNINQCITDTLRMLNNETKYKCEIDTTLEDVPIIMGDTGKINQVFTNLVMNATQAIEDQGKIIITTYRNDNTIYISVRDNGKGIPEENLRHLFDPFFTTKPVGEGTDPKTPKPQA